MTCAELDDLAVDYLYGTLDEGGRRAADAHLGACERCRQELRGLERTLGATRAALRGPLADEPPPGVRARIEAAARAAVAGTVTAPGRAPGSGEVAEAVRLPARPELGGGRGPGKAEGGEPELGRGRGPGKAEGKTGEAAGAHAGGRPRSDSGGWWAWLRRPWFLPAFASAAALALFFIARPVIVDRSERALRERAETAAAGEGAPADEGQGAVGSVPPVAVGEGAVGGGPSPDPAVVRPEEPVVLPAARPPAPAEAEAARGLGGLAGRDQDQSGRGAGSASELRRQRSPARRSTADEGAEQAPSKGGSRRLAGARATAEGSVATAEDAVAPNSAPLDDHAPAPPPAAPSDGRWAAPPPPLPVAAPVAPAPRTQPTGDAQKAEKKVQNAQVAQPYAEGADRPKAKSLRGPAAPGAAVPPAAPRAPTVLDEAEEEEEASASARAPGAAPAGGATAGRVGAVAGGGPAEDLATAAGSPATAFDTSARPRGEATSYRRVERPREVALPVSERHRRAEQAFAAGRFGEAVELYRALLRDFPSHGQAPLWRRRLAAGEKALESSPPPRPAAPGQRR